MGIELPAVKTPLDLNELAETLAKHAPELSDDAIVLLASHVVFETGYNPFCWNLGNAKTTRATSWNYTLYACGEELALSYAQSLEAQDPLHAKIVREYELDGRQMASINFTPPHPQCVFRAFGSLDEAVADFVGMLRNRFSSAWTSLRDPLPASYALELRRGGYYTLDAARYSERLTRVWLDVKAKLALDKASGEVVRDGQEIELPHTD